MQRERQLHDAEVGSQMPAGGRHLVNEKLTNLFGQIPQVRLRKLLQIGGPTDPFKHPASVRRPASALLRPAQMPQRHSVLRLGLLNYASVCREAWSASFSCNSGLPAVQRYSGVPDDLHGRRDRS
jgi:hypothetical protein